MTDVETLINKVFNSSAKYEERKQTVSIYLKEQDDTYYIICNKDNFNTCTFFATVKNKSITETISKDLFYQVKKKITK
jgi:hypothetical protein